MKVVVEDDGGETDTQSWTIDVKAEATGFVTGRVYSDEYLPEGETLSVKAVVTVDNHYGLYYGSPGCILWAGMKLALLVIRVPIIGRRRKLFSLTSNPIIIYML